VDSSRIARITPTGTVTEFGTGINANSEPSAITAGPDGNLWFTEHSSWIGRLELGAGATLSPASRDFGKWAVDTAGGVRQFTVTSTGTAPLIVDDASIGGANAGDFAIANDKCSGATVAPGHSCTIGVRFTPGAADARAAKLRVPDNAADGHFAALTGTGIAAPVSSPPHPSGGSSAPHPESAGLASTGPNVRWPAGVGAAVLVLGAALAFAGRKRGRRSI